jgi:endonuclease YncB( thermonuclease family)
MKKIILSALFLIWPLTAHAWVAKVVSISDGDTIKVFNAATGQEKIRLYGIDAPERGQPQGDAARTLLTSLVSGAVVDIESVSEDLYGNTVAIVWEQKKNVSQEMVRAGYAWVYRKYCDRPFCEYWLALEGEAKKNKVGLWQEADPVPPWMWRRMNCD